MQQEQPKVSIIVPVYNTEPYVKRCLQSILKQTLKSFEIIIVNDGSTDRSAAIIDEFATAHPDIITVVTKTNGGLGDARNHGIREAKGEYLGFVDSDDWIAPDMYKRLYSKAKQGHDVVICDMIETTGKKRDSVRSKGFRGSSFKSKEIIKYGTDPAFACNKLIKRQLFDHVQFPSIWYEDVATIPIILSYAKHPAYVKRPLYYYRKRSGNITSSNHAKVLDVMKAWDRLLKHVNPAFKQEAVFSVARSIHVFIGFKPKFAAFFKAYAKENRKLFENNNYYQQALKKGKIRNLLGASHSPSKQKKLRIYFYSSQISGRGGMETVLSTVCKGLLRKGHEVKIILTQPPVYRQWARKLPVCYTRINPTKTMKQSIRLHQLLRKLPKADILVALDASNIADAKRAVKGLKRRPLIASWVHFNMAAIKHNTFFSKADFHLAINKELQDDIISLTKNSRTHLIYNPVSIGKKIIPRPAKIRFLYVGRLYNYQKKVDHLLKALAKVKGRWRLRVIGDGNDGKRLKRMARRLGIDKKIKWEGWKSKPWAHVKEATCLIMPSAYEGFGLAAAEAMARGLPVVAGNCSGLKEIIKHDENGWLFPYHDVSALADILNRLANGSLPLPDPKTVQASVKPFGQQTYIDRLERILIEEHQKGRRRKKLKRNQKLRRKQRRRLQAT